MPKSPRLPIVRTAVVEFELDGAKRPVPLVQVHDRGRRDLRMLSQRFSKGEIVAINGSWQGLDVDGVLLVVLLVNFPDGDGSAMAIDFPLAKSRPILEAAATSARVFISFNPKAFAGSQQLDSWLCVRPDMARLREILEATKALGDSPPPTRVEE